MHICYKCQLQITTKRVPQLNLLISCISASSAPQILSLKYECTFLFWNFLIIDLCNSLANSLLEIFSVSTVPPKVYFIRKFIDHWSKSTLIFIIFRIFSNIKCFIRQYFIRSCSSDEIFKISIRHDICWKQALSSSSW